MTVSDMDKDRGSKPRKMYFLLLAQANSTITVAGINEFRKSSVLHVGASSSSGLRLCKARVRKGFGLYGFLDA